MNVASSSRPRAKPAPRPHGRERPTLRILGTEITLLDELRLRAEEELGIKIEFEILDFLSAQRKAATEPHTYDIYDQCFHNLDIVWFWRAIQPIDLERIRLWNEVTDLTKTGRITPNARIGYGDAPVSRLFVQPSQALGATPSRWISMLPTVHNLDPIAYRIDKVNGAAEMSSWAALLDSRWTGAVALVDEPAIGIFDAALAAQASGEASFDDIGNMSTEEIDRLLDVLMERKRAGHFHGFWKTAAEAAEFMAGGDVIVESMWSPGVSALRRRGVAVQEAVPQEGYRAWHGGLCLSRRLEGPKLDVAYEYLNWWLSGFAGAVVARQGYYMSVPNRVKAHLSPAEWAYWYEGKPAETDLVGPDGNRTIAQGSTRSGGSYWQRASTIAVWNTTMDEHNYLVRRWANLVNGG
jgi:putative spermidine/putrescine transport system substrate-binding protein